MKIASDTWKTPASCFTIFILTFYCDANNEPSTEKSMTISHRVGTVFIERLFVTVYEAKKKKDQ